MLARPPELARVLCSYAEKRHQHDTRSLKEVKEEENRDEEWNSLYETRARTRRIKGEKEQDAQHQPGADGVNLRSTMQQSKQFGRVRVRLDELDDEGIIDFAELLKKQGKNC